jgi:prolipoprotein diacylglyceryl transferase
VITLLAQIPPPPFQGFPLFGLDVRMYGLLIAIGALLAIRMATSRYDEFGGDPAMAERLSLWVLGLGFLGARIGYVIPRFDQFLDRPQAILAIWEGGLAIFGGLFLGTVAGWLLAHRWEMDKVAFADAVAPAVPLAQAIGRWGNYFNQELYGRRTDLPWALEVEAAGFRPGFQPGEATATFHPTFLYESLANAVLVVLILMLDRGNRLRRGSLIWVYAIGYGLIRTMTEYLRIDTPERYFGLSRNNWIAIAVTLVGIVGLIWWQRRDVPDVEEGDETADEPQAAGDTGEPDAAADTDDARAADHTVEAADAAADTDDAGAADHTAEAADAAADTDDAGAANEAADAGAEAADESAPGGSVNDDDVNRR